MTTIFQHLHSANKYLLVLFGFSIPVSTALTNVVLLGFFAAQWRQTVFFEDRLQKIMARGFVLLMLVACMTASPLQDNAEGWFFVFMTGLLFAGVNIRGTTAGKVKEQQI